MINSLGRCVVGLVLLVCLCHVTSTTGIPFPDIELSLGRGYGDHLNWTRLDEAFRDSALTRKPIMLLIHQKWCKACKELMPKFRENPYITKLASFFQMVNVMDEEEPGDPQFAPDGLYYPRILFISPDGVVHTEIFNPESANQYLYYYYEADSVARSMLKAVHTFYNVIDEETNEL